jgi:CO/xanthine dehydrogenase FAD-binding subunit
VRSFVPSFELRTPASLSATLELIAREPGEWRPFAGGTDLMVLMEAGKLDHKRFLNIRNLSELGNISVGDAEISIGALATYTDIRRDPALQRGFPLLCRAAEETGGIATQNRGTIGGNIANASPAADSPPALLVYDAALEMISTGGVRRVPYAGFHTGYKKMNLQPDELIARIILPRGAGGWKSYYRKVGTRRAQAISKVCVAAAAKLVNGEIANVRIALGSVAPTVIRATQTENALRGRKLDAAAIETARASIAAEISPIDDVRSTARYRARITQNLLEEFLQSAARP